MSSAKCSQPEGSKCNVSIFSLIFLVFNRDTLNEKQRRLLGDIEMKKLFKCLELFVGWLQGGLYDFTTLPVSMFKHMDPKDIDTIMSLHTKYPSKSLLY